MSNTILFGLPNSAGAQQFVTDYMDRGGLLDQAGWTPQLIQKLQDSFRSMLADGTLRAEPDPKFKVVFTNTATKTSDDAYRLCLEPRLHRHGARNEYGLSPALIEEMNLLNNAKWTVNPFMHGVVLTLAESEYSALVTKNPQWVALLGEAAKYPHIHLPVFKDRVTRLYGETGLSITSSKLNRACLDSVEKVKYYPWDDMELCSLLGIKAALSPEQAEANLASWQDNISSDPDLSKTRYKVWLWEMLEKGESGAMGGCDIRTSGQMIAAILARCVSLMFDTNIFGADERDCRTTISGRIKVPVAFQPWEGLFRSGATAKPLMIALLYGQASTGGAATLLWEDEKSAPIGWISAFGTVNEDIVLKHRDKWNSTYRHIVDEIGITKFYRAAKDLAAQYNDTFWRSYPEVLMLRQRLEEAFNHFMANQHGPAKALGPTIVAPHGATYTHTKWVVDGDGDTWRFRSPCEGWKHGLDISLKPMKNVASGHSFFVRWVHFVDAWMRHEVNMSIAALQRKLYGKVIGFGSVHDYWWVPVGMLPYMHSILRAVIVKMMKIWPPIVDQFLIDNGQQPMRQLSLKERKKFHRSVNRNRAFLSIG